MYSFGAVQHRFRMSEAKQHQPANFYRTAGLFLLLISLIGAAAQAQTLTPLHTFSGPPNDGANAYGALILDPFGNLYGTTEIGGTSNNGTVFSLTATGNNYSVLHNFGGIPDGSGPDDALLRDGSGNLYGTVQQGGADNLGGVFEFNAAGMESMLHSFVGSPDDGRFSYAPVIQDAASTARARGNLYGTTEFGGSHNLGTVFKVDINDNSTVLYSFSGPDGQDPTLAGVVRDLAGNLYGTTFSGGQYGNGVVFKLTPSGTESVLHSFSGTPDGAQPWASLVRDNAGNLYGTTLGGGSGAGTVFGISPSGAESVLHSFGGSSDGADPYAPLLIDSEGNLYGTTAFGGHYNQGTVFKIDALGNETILYSFTGASDGAQPWAGLIMDTAGNLYGTTVHGGSPNCNCGTVFKLTL
jgi:uncharacterized repeat protein (TIGR03803 family)